MSDDVHHESDELLDRLEASLEAEDLPLAHALLAQLRACAGVEEDVVAYAHARVVWLEEGPEAAEPWLERIVQRDSTHAEAHYDLGCIAADRGDEQRQIEHFLRVRALDARADRALGLVTDAAISHLEQVAREVLDRLPSMFAERLGHVPVLIEQRPSRTLVAEGFDPRALGLFEGPTEGVSDVPEPSRIVLYASNLLAEFPDEPELSEQIEVTVLHEVGHFFNLDEDDLEKLGLG